MVLEMVAETANDPAAAAAAVRVLARNGLVAQENKEKSQVYRPRVGLPLSGRRPAHPGRASCHFSLVLVCQFIYLSIYQFINLSNNETPNYYFKLLFQIIIPVTQPNLDNGCEGERGF